MGKKRSKRIKIPKDRDIEALIEELERSENASAESQEKQEIERIESVSEQSQEKQEIQNVDKKRQEFLETMSIEDKTIEIKANKYIKRRDAEMAEEKRRQNYLKAMNKLEENEQEEK